MQLTRHGDPITTNNGGDKNRRDTGKSPSPNGCMVACCGIYMVACYGMLWYAVAYIVACIVACIVALWRHVLWHICGISVAYLWHICGVWLRVVASVGGRRCERHLVADVGRVDLLRLLTRRAHIA
eukprot:COSAG01_NODE_13247_length_1612_cov_25.916722_1_plen_126_part_00